MPKYINNYKPNYTPQYLLLFEYCDKYKCVPQRFIIYKQWAIGEWYYEIKKKIINHDKYSINIYTQLLINEFTKEDLIKYYDL